MTVPERYAPCGGSGMPICAPVLGFDSYDVSNMGRVRSRPFTPGEFALRVLTPSPLPPRGYRRAFLTRG